MEKSTRNFQSVLESTPEGIFILKDDTILYANNEVYQLIGKDYIDAAALFIPEDQQEFEQLLQQKIANRKPIQSQLNLQVNEGSLLVDLTIVNTIFGATEALLIIMKDVSLQVKLSKEVLRAELAEENTKKLEKEIKERIKTEKELENLLLKTKAIYDSSSNIFLMTLDLEGRITYFNKHSQNYFEGIIGEAITQGVKITDYFKSLFNRSEILVFQELLIKVLNGKSRQIEIEFNNQIESKWIEIFMNPIYDIEGTISEVSLMSHDITIKKRAEKETFESLKEKEILLKEIHHRVKNNLQVISSILNLQSSFIYDPKTLSILQESRNRIRSMAIIHENLYRTTNFSSIDFAGYIKNLVINLSALYQREDYKIDIMIESGPNARTVQINLNPFTLIGATTRSGLLTAPMRARFGISSRLQYYTVELLTTIIQRSASILKMPITMEAAIEIAGRSRGTPRIANALLRRVRDFAQIKGNGTIDVEISKYALKALNVDAHGLDEMDNKILNTIIDKFKGGPVGLTTLATAVSESSETIEEVYEPFLIQEGFIMRTPRGREVTEKAYTHLGKVRANIQGGLF